MANVTVDQSGQGSAVERRLRHAPAKYALAGGHAAFIARVRSIRTPKLSVPGGSGPFEPAGRSFRGYGANHAQAPGDHGTPATDIREEQWANHRSDCDSRVRGVSKCSEKAWLRRAPRTAHYKYTLSICLTACTIPSLPSLLVPIRERPVGGSVKEFDHEDGSDLRTGLFRSAAGGAHDIEPDSVADRVRLGSRSGGTQRVGLRR
jgi:hypothetical protein